MKLLECTKCKEMGNQNVKISKIKCIRSDEINLTPFC
jgi:hypothetical protein